MSDIDDLKNSIHLADCTEFMEGLPDNSIDSCVTDPPYGLNFMSKKWDDGAITFDKRMWALLLRKLKPGAHLLAFGSTRTSHRMVCAIEDAGFEIRNTIMHVFGSGFPKGFNVRQGIEFNFLKEWLPDHDTERKFLESLKPNSQEWKAYREKLIIDSGIRTRVREYLDVHGLTGDPNTALKPSQEPIVLAQRPISEKTIVDNVLRWGVGALNVDGCRIAVNPSVDVVGKTTERQKRDPDAMFGESLSGTSSFRSEMTTMAGVLPSGRYPANLILTHHPDCRLVQNGETEVRDVSTHATSTKLGKHGIYGDYEVPVNLRHSFDVTKPEIWDCVEGCPVRVMNEQSGKLSKSGARASIDYVDGTRKIYFHNFRDDDDSTIPLHRQRYGDAGGAARFFKNISWTDDDIVPFQYCPKPGQKERKFGIEGSKIRHITVKPLNLVRYLLRLITPGGGVTIDQFMGSGTTAIAAEMEGFDWLGCEDNEDYHRLAQVRIDAWRKRGHQERKVRYVQSRSPRKKLSDVFK